MLENCAPIRLRQSYLQKNKLVAVPFEDAQHFTEETAVMLADACGEYGFSQAFVVPLEDVQECCFEMQLTAAAFRTLSDINIICVDFVIVEAGDRFAVLVDELFNTIAGPLPFVERALGASIENLEGEFLMNWVRDAYFPNHEKKSFEDLIQYYQEVRPIENRGWRNHDGTS